jgi:hypothetical protein
MPSELHLHPDRLRAHATAAAGLSEELRAVLRAVPELPGDGATEGHRLQAALRGAVRELAEISATLAGAAAAATAADSALARVLGCMRDGPGPELARPSDGEERT